MTPRRTLRCRRYRHTALALAALVLAAAPVAGQAAPAPDTLPPVVRVAADSARGFRWAYYLYVPPSLRADSTRSRPRTILVMPNNTGKLDDDPAVHERYVRELLPHFRRTAGRLGVAMLMPAFPRPASSDDLYTHALDRDAMLAKEPGLRRLDLQLLAMIDDARAKLAAEGIRAEDRVLMHGHSAAGMFVNRFVLLHPERVKAATIGAPGGWPTLPVAAHGGRRLRFPVGVADLGALAGRPFDLRRAREVPLYFFLGARDTNDSVPYDDSYDPEDRALVMELFGPTPAARWPRAADVVRAELPRATFHTYPGVGHEINQAMWADIWAFLGPHAAR